MKKVLKNVKEMSRNEVGITLIALVVTIVVLLILAATSMSMLTGDSGIITQSQKAKEDNVIAGEKEQIEIEVIGTYDENYTLDVATVNNNIKNNISGVTTDDATEFPLTVTYNETGHSYTIDKDGNVDKTVIYPLVSNTLKPGNYVEYNNKPYVVLYDMDSEYNWVEIVSVNPLENVTLGSNDTTTGAQGALGSYYRARWSYNNAISKLNTIAQNYLIEDLADRARCVGSNPINPLSEGTIRSYDKIKATDTNYLTDFSQLRRIGAAAFTDTNYEYYWLASRGTDGSGSMNGYYGLFHEDRAGTRYSSDDWRRIGNILNTNEVAYEDGEQDYDYYWYTQTAGFRPVIRLISTTKVIDGDGSSNSPYKLQK